MTVERFRAAARRALGSGAGAAGPAGPSAGRSAGDAAGNPPALASARIERGVFDVTVGGRTEMVTLMLRDGELLCTTSEGEHEGPAVRAVLELLAGGGGAGPEIATPSRTGGEAEPAGATGTGGESASGGPGPAARPAVAADAPARISVTEQSGGRTILPAGATRTVEASDQPASADREALSAALEDVVTAVVRSGVSAALSSPSVDEALKRLIRTAPEPLPLGVARWMARLRAAMSAKDVDRLARILDGAARLAEDLVTHPPDGAAQARIGAWLGTTADRRSEIEPGYDRTLVEVAREWLDGVGRTAIERRYLVDTQSGAVLREERGRRIGTVSIGPCPRVVSVGFAEIEQGAEPRRVRLLQYAVSLGVTNEDWAHVGASVTQRFAELADRYRKAVEAFPGLAEPFVLIKAERIELDDDGPVPIDADGDPLPLGRAEDPGAVARLGDLAEAEPIEWLAGRLTDVDGRLLLVPCSAAIVREGRTRLERLR